MRFFCLLFVLALGCKPVDRMFPDVQPPDAIEMIGELPSKSAKGPQGLQCPPVVQDPYDVCIVRDCELHACQLGWAAPEVAHRCGLGCMPDGMRHGTCPELDGVQTELKICGHDEPPAEACFWFGGPVIDERSNSYCCTPDAVPLPQADCVTDADCDQLLSDCQFAQCYEHRCYVQFDPSGTPCTVGTCFDGACQPSTQ